MENKDFEDIDAVYERYKDTDFSHAKKVQKIPKLQALQEKLKAKKMAENLSQIEQYLDDDVVELIKNNRNNREEMRRVNAVIRALFV